MTLYSVNYKGELSNNEWSIVTIWKTLEGAEKARKQYEDNWKEEELDKYPEYRIIKINTDSESDCIFDYQEV